MGEGGGVREKAGKSIMEGKAENTRKEPDTGKYNRKGGEGWVLVGGRGPAGFILPAPPNTPGQFQIKF